MFSQIKLYLYAFGSAAFMVLFGWFKLRGSKIDKLEEEIERIDKDLAHEKKKSEFEKRNVQEAKDAEDQCNDTYASGSYSL